jgi:hypothetical protein
MTLLVGSVLFLLVVFPLGYAWHLVLFKERFEAMGYLGRDQPIIGLGLAAMAIQALATALLFWLLVGQWQTIPAAAIAVGLLTAVIWSVQVFAHAAKFNVEVVPFLRLETAYFGVQFVLVFALYAVAFSLLSPM